MSSERDDDYCCWVQAKVIGVNGHSPDCYVKPAEPYSECVVETREKDGWGPERKQPPPYTVPDSWWWLVLVICVLVSIPLVSVLLD